MYTVSSAKYVHLQSALLSSVYKISYTSEMSASDERCPNKGYAHDTIICESQCTYTQ